MALPTPAPQNTTVRILIVDDHPGTAATLARAVALLGPDIEALSATSGKSALEQVGEKGIDLLITDMMMPDMNGMDLIEKLRAHPAGHPSFTILMTAYDVPGLKESARRLKVNQVIIKPFPPERLSQIVSEALEEIRHSRPAQTAAGSRQVFKILIADDISDNVTLLSRYLQNEGYAFISASTGVEVLEKTRREMPDLILLDVNMPERDGFDVLREIRSDPTIEHVAVIILTAARPDSIDMQTGLNLGADDYMVKPFDRRELMARIHAKLRARESEQSIRRRNKMFSVLPEIGREFSARTDLDELGGLVIRRAVETLGAVSGHLFLADGSLHCQYSLAAPPATDFPLPPLETLLYRIETSPEGLILENTQQDARLGTSPRVAAHSILLVPMLGRFAVIGLLLLVHEQAGYFNADHSLLLRAIASQAAIALESAQLHTSLSAQSAQSGR